MTDSTLSNTELRDLYRELILDHARSPRHFGKLPDATHSAEGINPLCGDKLKLYFLIDGDDIKEAKFEGSGCAISVASASLLTDLVTGRDTAFANACFETLVSRLSGREMDQDVAEVDLGKLEALEGVREFPSRVKCATLAWHALDRALKQSESPATTE